MNKVPRMVIEAPYSKYNKTNLKIAIAICIGLAIIFAYDGYISKYEWSLRRSFYEEHIKDGKMDSTLVFNQQSPFVLFPVAVIFTIWFWLRKNTKLLADENELIVSTGEKIPYDSIEKIDRTYFGSKDYFVITYKNKSGADVKLKLSARTYDNLGAILEHLVTKIT
jgi:hypothetical protein